MQTQTLERALEILFVLAESRTTLSVSEIAEKVNIPESTTYRLLKTLEHKRVIDRKPGGDISLGVRILHLAKTLQGQLGRDLLVAARPVMEELTEKVNESSVLVVRRGNIGVSVHHVEGNRMIGFVEKNGRIHPLHLGASGKAILAFEKEKEIRKILSSIEGINEKNVFNDLQKIRDVGYAKTVGDVDPDIIGIAAPVFDESARVFASLAIIGPENRFNEAAIKLNVAEVTRSAEEITKRITHGYGVTVSEWRSTNL